MFVHGKNSRWNKHVPHISTEKPLSTEINSCFPPLFSKFLDLMQINQLSASTMMPKKSNSQKFRPVKMV